MLLLCTNLFFVEQYSILTRRNEYTEKEYKYALDKNNPIIAFLYENPNILPARRTDKVDEKRKKLEEFRKFTGRKMVKHLKNAHDLGSVIIHSLIKLIKQHPAIGWVKTDKLPKEDSTNEINKL